MLDFLYGIIAGGYNTTVAPPPEPPPPPPTCTPVCGAWSYTYGSWSGWSACSGGTQTRTRTVSGTRTCTASNCSTYTETSSTTETESQSCTVWYCSSWEYGSGYPNYGSKSQYTSATDQSTDIACAVSIRCSTTGYPAYETPSCQENKWETT